ncbi:hypothetical protein PS910_02028 [Pseudomonas fluorescens]|nr:hypothetical protein PS910_02028 [Pseudomonas fluorescens]
MASSKRKHSGIERELVRALTHACETAKSEIIGFTWLTHRVDYDRFPQSLVVTWVFDSDNSMNAAVANQEAGRIEALTLAAFQDIGIVVANITSHVELDSEERCASQHGGDWAGRLGSRQKADGKHGQRH